MDHAYQANVSQTKPSLAGYQVGYPQPASGSSPATIPGPGAWFAVVEELRNTILVGGLIPDAMNLTQVSQAVALLGGQAGAAAAAPFATDIETALTQSSSALAAATVAQAAAGTALGDVAALALSTGAGGVGLDSTLNYVVGTLGRHVALDWWNPTDFPWLAKFDGSTNDTAAIQACITAAAAAGNGVYMPPGTTTINSVSLPSNTVIRGAGQSKTIVKQISGANDAWHLADPGSSTTFTSNVTITDLQLLGTVATDGFQEVLHLMFTQGAADLLIERVAFVGMRGDGLYIGTGNERGQNPTQVRHNQRVRVRNCFFDGLVMNNRNGISVEDCDGCWIEDNYFTRLSQASMPGPIDIENDSVGSPAGSGAILSNINVLNNKFFNNSGAGTINVNLHYAQSAMTTPVRGINIIGNWVDTAVNVGVSIIGPAIAATDYPHDILVEGNAFRNMQNPFVVQGVKGVRFEDNFFSETLVGATIGNSAGLTCYDIEFSKNIFYLIATSGGGGTAINCFGVTDLKIKENLFDSFGIAGGATANYGIDFLGTTAQVNVQVVDNRFYLPVASSAGFDVRDDGGQLQLSSYLHAGNELINVNGGLVVANGAIQTGDWQTPTLLNGWVAFGVNDAAPQFMKDRNGRVWLRGTIKSGTTTAGLSLLSIPAGYRPGATIEFCAYNGTATGFVQVVYSNGDLQIIALPGGNTVLSLNGISWEATQ